MALIKEVFIFVQTVWCLATGFGYSRKVLSSQNRAEFSTSSLGGAQETKWNENGTMEDPGDWIVLLGAHELSGRRNDAQLSRNVVKIKIHEKYNPKHWFNDIAILTLSSPVKFSASISPVCLPAQGSTESYDGRLAYAKGWGHTEEDGTASDFLRHVTKRILKQSQCRQIYKFNEYQDHMLCAYQPGKGTCQVFSTKRVTKFKSFKLN